MNDQKDIEDAKVTPVSSICDKGDNCPYKVGEFAIDSQSSRVKITNEFNPSVNPKAISIIEQEDGNWKGYAQKFGKLIEVREISPNDCLVKLLTHNGQAN